MGGVSCGIQAHPARICPGNLSSTSSTPWYFVPLLLSSMLVGLLPFSKAWGGVSFIFYNIL